MILFFLNIFGFSTDNKELINCFSQSEKHKAYSFLKKLNKDFLMFFLILFLHTLNTGSNWVVISL